MHDEGLNLDELEVTARGIADRVMKVKNEYDRIGGLYEMAYKGALAGLNYQYQVNS